MLSTESNQMVNWKRIIVGHAFELPSGDINYYRDLFLLWPFLLFLVTTLASLFDPNFAREYFYKCLTGLLVCLVLAKERWWLIGGAGAFVFFRSLPFLFQPELFWDALTWVVVGGLLLVIAMVYLVRREGRVSYKMPEKMSVASLLVVLAGLLTTLALFVFWIREP